MASAESRLFQALEEMTREYGKNPSPALKNRIDFNRERYNKMRGIQAKATPKKKKPVAKKGPAKKVAKKTDPEKPYYSKPTPGKPGWNVAKKNKRIKKSDLKKRYA